MNKRQFIHAINSAAMQLEIAMNYNWMRQHKEIMKLMKPQHGKKLKEGLMVYYNGQENRR